MHILYIIGRELEYSRNDVLFRAFQKFAEVDCFSSAHRPKSILLNSILISARCIPALLSDRYDLVFFGFYGHIILSLVGWLTKKPILFDAFLSTYDTLGGDRQVFSRNSIPGHLAWWLDNYACRCSDRILLDTPEHCSYFRDIFQIPMEKLTSIPVGCNEDLFKPRSDLKPNLDKFQVLFYSSYLPLHGVDTVIKAANLLRNEPIKFKIIGEGQTYPEMRKLADQLNLANIEFSPVIPLQALPAEIASADVCLGGHFGKSDKAGRVIPGKIYQILAMGSPLVAGDTPATRNLLSDEIDSLLITPGNPEALSQSLLRLHKEPELRTRLAQAGRELFINRCSESVIASQLKIVCGETMRGMIG
jgi:glycosyltransferase involved in cell wall biosynthesis